MMIEGDTSNLQKETPKDPKDCSLELFCDSCGHYPIQPLHGHFVCPVCRMPTKCCEGGPLER